jgi:hypothetical protein
MSRHHDAMMEVFRNGRVLRISMVDAATSQEQHSLHSALASLHGHVLSSTPRPRGQLLNNLQLLLTVLLILIIECWIYLAHLRSDRRAR